ncbi:MAG: hypothetical protein M1837_005678 [Sclerophora amabilis]|nr:MAG: hypothetical protein M1837_005678 [Sclerophora amabilis]
MADQDGSNDVRDRQEENNEASNTTSPSNPPRNAGVRYGPITTDARDEDNTSGDNQPSETAIRPRAAQQLSSTYGSTSHTSYDAGHSEQARQETASPTAFTTDEGNLSQEPPGPSSMRQAILSQDRTSKAKKPAMARRTSSTFLGPHRGQEFSVDDDRFEVEQEFGQKQSPTAASSSGRRTLRRKPSTLRRRGTAPPSNLPRVDSNEEEMSENPVQTISKDLHSSRSENGEEEEPLPAEDEDQSGALDDRGGDDDDDDDDDEDDDDDLSDAESFTLKDKQNAINETHPFGVRIWKPALYKKNRSVEKTAEGDIHSSPGGRVSRWLFLCNILWSILFGWWLAVAALLGAVVCFAFGFAPSSIAYGRVLLDLAGYLLYPFGKFVKLEQDEAYAEEDEGQGRSISEYEQWQSGDLEDGRLFFGPVPNRSLVGRRRNSVDSASESESLLGRTRRGHRGEQRGSKNKQRLFGRGEWTVGRVIFFVFFYGLISPSLLLASGLCWLMVFWIPMGRTTLLLFYHLRRHPLALSFHSDAAYSRSPDSPSSSILLCTYRAVGIKYWKYTVDGTNIFLINLLGVVVFVIFDYWVLDVALGLKFGLTHPAFIFMLSLFSIIPLAYFIGQAVASISAQSSMGLGAAINAFFSTIVEVFLYCVALKEGKGQLVEGSIIGSIFAGILFLPGLSMCFGAIKRKTQRFNVKSAGVTSTMLLFAVIAAFGPTLFYQIYGTHELNCLSCVDTTDSVPAVTDRFFIEAVRPYCWFAAVLLFMSYIIGLWFTLRTHAAVIWEAEVDEKKQHTAGHHEGGMNQSKHGGSTTGVPNGAIKQQNTGNTGDAQMRASIRDSQLYKRILSQSLKQVGMTSRGGDASRVTTPSTAPQSPHMVPPKHTAKDGPGADGGASVHIPGLSEEDNQSLIHEVAEMAATAATVAARDATRAPRKTSLSSQAPSHPSKPGPPKGASSVDGNDVPAGVVETAAHGGGHDAPNWSRSKSAIILMGATLLYAVIAEILVNTVDVVLDSFDVDEKFLGITLFALVPNTTEFLNAISFAMNGNIALSMEIGSAYALQVCLLQIPALVLFSAVHGRFIDPSDLIDHTFSLIFPQWDMVTVILCVFLLSYMYGEGKSNYFKGSILILSYLVVIVGFYLSGMAGMDSIGPSRFDTLTDNNPQTFKTIGRSRGGIAY